MANLPSGLLILGRDIFVLLLLLSDLLDGAQRFSFPPRGREKDEEMFVCEERKIAILFIANKKTVARNNLRLGEALIALEEQSPNERNWKKVRG